LDDQLIKYQKDEASVPTLLTGAAGTRLLAIFSQVSLDNNFYNKTK
jgi:hypothetical protein